jgi:hypothetical protein
MICKNQKCNKEHDGSYGAGNFCSSNCSHSRTWTKEVNKRRSEASKKAHILYKNKYLEGSKRGHTPEAILKAKATIEARLEATSFADLGYGEKRRRVFKEQGGKCSICEIDSWREKPISLRLDHKDGNRGNNSRENLRGICPNCDSQLETYCGKRAGNRFKVSDEKLLEALRNSETVSQALRKVGLSDSSGSRYIIRCLRILDGVQNRRFEDAYQDSRLGLVEHRDETLDVVRQTAPSAGS